MPAQLQTQGAPHGQNDFPAECGEMRLDPDASHGF